MQTRQIRVIRGPSNEPQTADDTDLTGSHGFFLADGTPGYYHDRSHLAYVQRPKVDALRAQLTFLQNAGKQ